MPAHSSVSRELRAYMRARMKWWRLPILLLMLPIGTVIVFAQGSALAPLIHTVFGRP